jgi:hypothetical protein
MLLASLKTEGNEFVRPALIGALAAVDEQSEVQRALVVEANRGVDFFRSAVIDALGRHRAAYAIETLVAVANLEGPLQDDAILALGRIGGERARAALAAHANASASLMPAVHAARCLAGDRCEDAVEAIVEAAGAPGRSAVLVAAMAGLSALASEGTSMGTAALVTLGQAGGEVRDEAALALAAAAVRNPAHVIAWLDAASDAVRAPALALMKVGFEDLEEDFGKEQFYAAARASYWAAAEGSAGRRLAATLIQTLEF